jgi:hypothetical protein
MTIMCVFKKFIVLFNYKLKINKPLIINNEL